MLEWSYYAWFGIAVAINLFLYAIIMALFFLCQPKGEKPGWVIITLVWLCIGPVGMLIYILIYTIKKQGASEPKPSDEHANHSEAVNQSCTHAPQEPPPAYSPRLQGPASDVTKYEDNCNNVVTIKISNP